mmetsp:Transcript_7840/g.32980  ORF Transcript_7840/g.32980 Transcript_7840/m.32980 type:complete len:426 (-) Transcript_7840:43-1320(-)
MNTITGRTVEQLIVNDIDSITSHFQASFNECILQVQKPNVLVCGVTGAGKSSLINAVFGSNVVAVGDGIPVTAHFVRIEPPDKPVVVYDSKGLEDGFSEEFIAETRAFFEGLRKRPRLQEHIHAIWYVVNAASGRFESFEAQLIREVFAPTPVVVVLNKCDVASADQLNAMEQAIASFCNQLPHVKGVYRLVAARKNFSQNWCPSCHSDDVTFKSSTAQLFCDDCDHVEVMTERLHLGPLINTTVKALPDLAKEAFLFAQVESLQQKDERAKMLVANYAMNISMDVAGRALDEVGEMVGRLFVLWGWNMLGVKITNALVDEMREEYNSQELSVRLAMIAADTILKRKLSRSVIACLGVMVSRPLRKLSEQLLAMVDHYQEFDVQSFTLPGSGGAGDFSEQFMEAAFQSGIPAAIDQFWSDAMDTS